ncbi:hypothetical protein [Pseudotabrizicola formosa]|uniref:hypothetical protein n=1 Tax=Pseudotabrizicola formosa TaxID=2030009 RepID=UPI000CD28EE6|nr:hypothetical protein [Pseudotabrizicola formosa]
MKHSLSLALAGLFCATGAQAFEVTGGSLSLGYSSFVGSSEATDVSKLSLGSSMEFALSHQFALQGDFALTQLDASNTDNLNFGLHAIVHANESTSVGAYVGRDRFEGQNLNYFGFEVGHQAGLIDAEGYVTFAKDGGTDGTVIGIKGDYALTGTAMVGARLDNLNIEGADTTRFGLTGAVDALPGVTVTGELGRARIEGLGSEPYVSVGVKVTFGEKRGTSFERRSIIDLLPGG